jgi:tetratricopeptide (TPR) repeat protein
MEFRRRVAEGEDMKKLMATMGLAVLLAGGAAWGQEPGTTANTPQTAAQLYQMKANIARARGQYGPAVYWYLEALHRDRQDPVLYNGLGIAQLKLGERGMARKSFTDAVKLNPQYVNALNNLGATYCLQRKYKPSVKYLKKALALDEPVAATHVNLAEAWMGEHKLDRAMNEYARALELDPDVLDSSTNGGMIAQIETPGQRAVITFLIARAYARRGNMEGALEFLQRAKDLNYPHMEDVYKEPEFAKLWKDPRLLAIVKPRSH